MTVDMHLVQAQRFADRGKLVYEAVAVPETLVVWPVRASGTELIVEDDGSIGRNGLFTYNQMSHSIDCGLRAAENTLGAGHRIEAPEGLDLMF